MTKNTHKNLLFLLKSEHFGKQAIKIGWKIAINLSMRKTNIKDKKIWKLRI